MSDTTLPPPDSAPFSAWAERALLTPSVSRGAQILSASMAGPCGAGDALCFAAIGTSTGVAVFAYESRARDEAPAWHEEWATALSGTFVTVSLSGERLAIGNDDGVRVYERTPGGNWLQLGGLITMRGVAAFEGSVALDGQTLAVGAHDYPNEGRAYVYELSLNQWQLSATLGTEAGVGVPASKFGVSVGNSDGTVMVGQTPPDQPGRIHVYENAEKGFQLVQTLQPRDPAAPDEPLTGEPPELFGYSLSLSGNRLVGRAGGVAQVFEREAESPSAWSFEASTTVLGAASYHQRSVAIDAKNVVIGEPKLGLASNGAVFPWQGTAPPPSSPWDPADPYITENPSKSGAEFGRVVAVGGSWLLAAATDHARLYRKVAF